MEWIGAERSKKGNRIKGRGTEWTGRDGKGETGFGPSPRGGAQGLMSSQQERIENVRKKV